MLQKKKNEGVKKVAVCMGYLAEKNFIIRTTLRLANGMPNP